MEENNLQLPANQGKVAVFGLGYVGMTAAICLAQSGYKVWGVDPNSSRVQDLKRGHMPLFEAHLDEILKTHLTAMHFDESADAAIEQCEYALLCVGTPMDPSTGKADTKYILEVCKTLLGTTQTKLSLIIKSTVPPGTNQMICEFFAEHRPQLDIEVISNPEFMRQGHAYEDFSDHSRVVLGVNSEQGKQRALAFYQPLLARGEPSQLAPLVMSAISAEISKYAANSFLATRVAYINEIAKISDDLQADITDIRQVLGRDSRIGASYFSPGLGYGGYCLPKDTEALATFTAGDDASIIRSVIASNKEQIERLSKRVISRLKGSSNAQAIDAGTLPLAGIQLAFWGLSFKGGTDDIRQSPAIDLAMRLLKLGASLQAYDPQAFIPENHPIAKAEHFHRINQANECLQGSQALIIATDWDVFQETNLSIVSKLLPSKLVFDLRNMLDAKAAANLGFEVIGVGRKTLPS